MTDPHEGPGPGAVPGGLIDPHVHQWDPYTTPRHSSARARLLRPVPRVPAVLGRLAPRADREFVGDPHHVLKPYLPRDYSSDTGALDVRSVVHIEAAWVGEDPFSSVDETRWVAALPLGQEGTPDLGAVVVHADPRWKDVGAVLDAHLEASPLVRGARHSLPHHDRSDVRDFESSHAVAASRSFIDGFAAIAERGLTFELWLYSHQLETVHDLVSEYPATTFVLNHYGTPVGLFGPRGDVRTAPQRARLLDVWREQVARLAEHPNVVAKHSGLGMPILGGTPTRPIGVDALGEFADRAAPLVRHLHECFGPERTMWASNYPIDKPGLTVPATVQVVLDVLGSDAAPRQLFHDVAARTYRIGPHRPTTQE